jgi:flagellar biosynthesis GTPase FlhF
VWTAGIGLRLGGAQIDALIEPRAYSFCSERMFFDPAVNRHLLPVTRNVAIITVTRNVTDYGVVNTRVIDRGLGVDRLEAAVGRSAPRPRVLEVDSVSAVRGVRGQRDAVTIFRPAVRPRADLTPPRGRAAEKRREADATEAAKQLAQQRELHEKTRQEMERRQAAERRILEQQHGRENKKPPAVANLEQRQEQEHRALEERQHQERRQLEASREEARRQRETQASAERRSAESRAPAQAPPSGKGKEAKGRETPGKGSKAKPEEKDRKG